MKGFIPKDLDVFTMKLHTRCRHCCQRNMFADMLPTQHVRVVEFGTLFILATVTFITNYVQLASVAGVFAGQRSEQSGEIVLRNDGLS